MALTRLKMAALAPMQGKRETRSQGESGTSQEGAKCITHVGIAAFDGGPTPCFVGLLADESRVAEGATSSVAGVFG